MLTRRRFLVVLPTFAASAQALAAYPSHKKKIASPVPVCVYFGTDPNKSISKGIYQSRFDPGFRLARPLQLYLSQRRISGRLGFLPYIRMPTR